MTCLYLSSLYLSSQPPLPETQGTATGWRQDTTAGWRQDKTPRPTSSPDYLHARARRPLGKAVAVSLVIPQRLSLVIPPSRLLAQRLAGHRHPAHDLPPPAHWPAAGAYGGAHGQAVQQAVHLPHAHMLHLPHARAKMNKKGVHPLKRHQMASSLNAQQLADAASGAMGWGDGRHKHDEHGLLSHVHGLLGINPLSNHKNDAHQMKDAYQMNDAHQIPTAMAAGAFKRNREAGKREGGGDSRLDASRDIASDGARDTRSHLISSHLTFLRLTSATTAGVMPHDAPVPASGGVGVTGAGAMQDMEERDSLGIFRRDSLGIFGLQLHGLGLNKGQDQISQHQNGERVCGIGGAREGQRETGKMGMHIKPSLPTHIKHAKDIKANNAFKGSHLRMGHMGVRAARFDDPKTLTHDQV